MGDSPPVSSRPYTLALKHHRWVQEEIETLERAGVITKSMSPWASPIVVVPKKSQPGEPPKKRLCIDFRKINDLQQKVITEGKSKGCLSLIPLPKIDEMYAKLKGAKFFSTIDLRSGYYHIALGANNWKLVLQTAGYWFSPLAMQDAFCLVCWFSCSFVSEACACFGEWL